MADREALRGGAIRGPLVAALLVSGCLAPAGAARRGCAGQFGAVLGLASVKTGHRLKTNVAMQFWYDFLLSSAVFLIHPDQPSSMGFSLPF